MGRRRAQGNERLGDHVQRRASGILELRFPIPADAQHAFRDSKGRPQRTVIRSLGTRDHNLANAKADILRTEFRNQISKARTTSKVDGLTDYLVDLYEAELAEFRNQLADTSKQRQRALIAPSGEDAKKLESERIFRSDYGTALLSEEPDEVAATAGWAADEFFARLGVPIDRHAPEYRKVVAACADALADTVIAKAEMEKGLQPPTPLSRVLNKAIERKALPPNALTEEGKLPIKEYFETAYAAAGSYPGAPSTGERNISGKRHSVALFAEIMENKPIASITKGDLYKLLEKLLKLPDSRRLSGDLKKLSAGEIIQKVEDGSLKLPPIHPKTVNKHISNLASIVDFAERRQHIKPTDVRGVKAKFKDTEDAGRPFTSAELNRIFALPLFKGCAGEKVEGGLFKPGAVKVRDDRFWIPLVLLFTGGRSSEIVGLETADVVLDHETPHFLIVSNKTRPNLKNNHSRRMVPIHSRLIEFGFLDFVKQRIDRGDVRLFPMAGPTNYVDRSYGKTQRSLSAAFIMRQFNRTHLKHANADQNIGSIKCFRNTFEQESTSKISSDESRQRLTGRKVVSTARIYTNNIPRDDEQRSAQLKKLKDEIELIKYDFLDLSGLACSTSC